MVSEIYTLYNPRFLVDILLQDVSQTMFSFLTLLTITYYIVLHQIIINKG